MIVVLFSERLFGQVWIIGESVRVPREEERKKWRQHKIQNSLQGVHLRSFPDELMEGQVVRQKRSIVASQPGLFHPFEAKFELSNLRAG